jgi:drug/metabolite transporter (DMT)-like permease
MNTANLIQLFVLAAIWGCSFLFMRIASPVLGPAVLIEYRLAFAGAFLLLVGLALRKKLHVRANWGHYLVLGFFNSALPFFLFAYAARTLSASMLSVLNATAPLWGALLGAIWTRTGVSLRTAAGLLLGTAGVALLVGFDHVSTRPGAGVAVVAALIAAFCYGIASIYAKTAKKVEPFSNAHGSMWAAAILIVPLLPFFPSPGVPTANIWGATLALGIACSGLAYILYFKLIADVGATSALSVTFLTPVFGILWGALFLGEVVGWYTVAGSAIVLLGTALVTGFIGAPKKLAPVAVR